MENKVLTYTRVQDPGPQLSLTGSQPRGEAREACICVGVRETRSEALARVPGLWVSVSSQVVIDVIGGKENSQEKDSESTEVWGVATCKQMIIMYC